MSRASMTMLNDSFKLTVAWHPKKSSHVRDEAFDIYHYACIGLMRFLSFNLSHMPFWPRSLERLRADPSYGFLEAGCSDQDIAGEQLFGCDLEQVFIDLGYRLFRDTDRLKASFAVGDLNADEATFNDGEPFQKLHGKIDIVFASSLLHMWDWDTQFKVATRLVKICRPKSGVMITGRQMRSTKGDHYTMTGMKDNAVHYRHDPETMERFWAAVGEATQSCWKVEAGLYWNEEIDQTKDMPWADEKMRMMWWCATRE
ncbi:uncharacterized protein N7496_000752 [Penicillium cataractarum]|uniref:Methyltransferase type 11 domain-containing protein n=1 Tax=Penicillium cataractarum TaxID=2100454 RepID=A0A9W9VV04_9EURO|nr:uncharacterized protein N7496_000752 [Penicillium cataractarum]KAJ5389684.1 hypothetical protein N7496_000752 [Penicillium cataractarum]